jgi:hypothetical protein
LFTDEGAAVGGDWRFEFLTKALPQYDLARSLMSTGLR